MKLTSKKKKKKIKTKNDAIKLLQEFLDYCNECMMMGNFIEQRYFSYVQMQIARMINSINNSEDFFNNYFKNKTRKQIMEWIEKEAKKW